MPFLTYFTYLIDLIAAGLLGVFFAFLFGKDPFPLALGIATGIVLLIALSIHAYPFIPFEVEPAWQQISIDLDDFSPIEAKKYPPEWKNSVVWKDIFWLSKSRGWLSGAVTEGGGHDDVGVGVLPLATIK